MGSKSITAVVVTCDAPDCAKALMGTEDESRGDLFDSAPEWISGTVDHGTVAVEWVACRPTHLRPAIENVAGLAEEDLDQVQTRQQASSAA